MRDLKRYFTTIDAIQQGYTINDWHIVQFIDAFTGVDEFELHTKGSFTIDGELFLNVDSNPIDLETDHYVLGIDPISSKVKYYKYIKPTPSQGGGNFDIFPLEIDATKHTAWNSGKGDIVNNTAFGRDAFINNVTGNHNTVVGSFASHNNESGSYIVAIGDHSAFKSTAASDIISIGSSSLYNNLSNSNIGIGKESLYYNTLGENNIGIGTKSLYNNIKGKNNLSLGNFSSLSLSGDNNISLGVYSSYGILNGMNRISIGSFSGRTPGNNLLEIHSYSDLNDTSDPLILGDFSNRWLRLSGQLKLNFNYTPFADLSNTPYQLLFDSGGDSFLYQRGYTMGESDDLFIKKSDLTPGFVVNEF